MKLYLVLVCLVSVGVVYGESDVEEVDSFQQVIQDDPIDVGFDANAIVFDPEIFEDAEDDENEEYQPQEEEVSEEIYAVFGSNELEDADGEESDDSVNVGDYFPGYDPLDYLIWDPESTYGYDDEDENNDDDGNGLSQYELNQDQQDQQDYEKPVPRAFKARLPKFPGRVRSIIFPLRTFHKNNNGKKRYGHY